MTCDGLSGMTILAGKTAIRFRFFRAQGLALRVQTQMFFCVVPVAPFLGVVCRKDGDRGKGGLLSRLAEHCPDLPPLAGCYRVAGCLFPCTRRQWDQADEFSSVP